MKKDAKEAKDVPAGAETPEVVIEKGTKSVRQRVHIAVKVVLYLAVGALFLAILQPQLPDVITAFENPSGVSAEELVLRKERDRVTVGIVYSEYDEWAPAECERLGEKIGAEYDIITEIMSDGSLSALSEGVYDLVISVGHTSMCGESYLSCYMRLGSLGYEIGHTEDASGRTVSVDIIAFGAETARTAVDRFASYFLQSSRLLRAADRLYVSVVQTEDASLPVIMRTDVGDGIGILTVTKPGADTNSLAALDALIADSSPDLVVFCGGLDCGCSGRSELATAWAEISALLNWRGVRFCCVFALEDRTSAVPEEVIYEVISSCQGFVENSAALSDRGRGDGRQAGGRTCLTFTDPGGTPVYSLYMIDAAGFDGAAEVRETSDWMLSVSRAIERTTGRTVPSSLICPGITLSAAASLPPFSGDEIRDGVTVNEAVDPYLLSFSDLLGETLSAVRVSGLVCTAGNTNTGVAARDSTLFGDAPGDARPVSLGLTGSLGFNSFGLGGRFELNNSLRGGVVISAGAGGDEPSMEYRYASKLGAVKR